MGSFLLKLFVKDYKNTQSPAVRSSIGSLAGTMGIICNALLALGKLIAGSLVGSVAIIADALNNLTDAASSVVTLLGFRLARRPADADHPYGHARYEYLSGLLVSVLILFVGVELVKSSVGEIITPEAMAAAPVTFAVLMASIAVKLWMWEFFRSMGKKIGSSTLEAASVDSRNDVIATTAVLLGCLVNRLFGWNIDGYVGLAVAVFILYSGVLVANETVSPLLGEQADGELIKKITQLVLSHPQVLGIHDLLIHDYGPGQCYASVHAELSGEEDPLVCHDIIDDIECDALAELNVHLVIHYDPVMPEDEEWNRLRRLVERIVEEIDPGLSVHDLRLVLAEGGRKLAFDLEVPYEMGIPQEQLKGRIDEALKQENCPYEPLIRFDGKE